MTKKVNVLGFECDYEINSKNGKANIHCTSQRLGLPYLCLFDNFGKIRKEVGGSFGKLGLDSKMLSKTKELCLLNGFYGELTLLDGIKSVKSTIRNAIEGALDIVL